MLFRPAGADTARRTTRPPSAFLAPDALRRRPHPPLGLDLTTPQVPPRVRGPVSEVRAVASKAAGGMHRKAEEEPIPVFVWATTRTPPGAHRGLRSRRGLSKQALMPAPRRPPLTRARARWRRLLPALGPAFVAAIAYVDPGNFATNIGGGASFGYTLVWVVVLANVVAMLVQYLSAKTGIATGRDIAELCRDRLPRPARWGLWLQAELVAMATDLAEFVGTAIALQLLFGLPGLPAAAITAVVAVLLLQLRSRGRRPFEVAIIGLLAVVALAFAYEVFVAAPAPADVAGGLVPGFAGTESLLLASGIVGATVMPHAVYVHSALTAPLGKAAPDDATRRRLLAGQRVDVGAALGIAGLVNVSMLVVAAALLHDGGIEAATLQDAHAGLGLAAGAAAALAFGIALLASGLSSASVGTCAGEVVMQGFLRRRIPSTVRRGITMLPSVALLATGADTTTALVLSQVVLSFGIPFTLVPLILLTRRRDVMGSLVNRPATTAAAAAVAAVIIALNAFLIHQVIAG
jgi:manganese transport protein